MKNYILMLILVFGLPLTINSQNFEVIKSGKGGNTSGQMLRRINSDVLAHNPTTTIVLAGTNDFLNIPKLTSIEDYESNLRTIVDKILNNGSDVIIMTIPTIIESIWIEDKTDEELALFEPEGPEGKVVLGNTVVSRIASEKDIVLVDTYTLFKNNLNFLSRDGVHQTDEGSRAMSRLLRDAIVANGLSTSKIVLLGDSITNRYDDIFIQYLIDNPIDSPAVIPVHIKKRNASNFAIDGGNGGENRQNIKLWASNKENVNQRWVEIDRGNGFYSYRKEGTNFCIDGNRDGENGQNVYLWSCDSNNQNQHWKKEEVGNNAFKLIKRNALDFALNGGIDGANDQNIALGASSSSSQDLHWFINPTNTLSTDTIEGELKGVLFYPNPVTASAILKNASNSNFRIYDINGRLVFTKSISSESEAVNLSELFTGIYFAEVIDNTKKSVLKIIKN